MTWQDGRMNPSMELSDPSVPAVQVLMGPEAGELLGAILAQAGGRVRSHAISQVRYVPGTSITVQYRVDVLWGSGRPTREMMVATSGIEVPAGTPVFSADGVEIAAWRFPNDPFLPGLPVAADPARSSTLLAQLGAPTETTGVRTRAYRAGRRGVIELSTPEVTVFIKVVRPERAAALQRTHKVLSDHVPVPHSFGWSEEHGIVALQALPGRTLRKSLEARSSRLPSPAALIDLLDRFPPPDAGSVAVAGPRRRVTEHGRLIAAVCPELAPRVDAIVDRLHTGAEPGADPVHGDFHASQILTSGADVVGLVDVDTAGTGERIDDLASLLGQLATLGQTSSAKRDIDRYGAGLIGAYDRLVDPVELRLRTAAAVFGLATGPFRVQLPKWRADTERRVALAERWIRSADEVG
jgi:Ser/Thr protein kinase RdoA (MazF antagonist)